VFSPGAAIVPLGILLLLPQSDRASLAVYVTCATAYGMMASRGLGPGISVVERLVIIALIEAIFFAVYGIARKTRQGTLRARGHRVSRAHGLAAVLG
jgi:hypothetical protein